MSSREQDMDRWLAATLGPSPFQRTPASDDASFRRYFRITDARGHSRVLMDAPPQREDCRPFVDVANRLRRAGVTVPQIFEQDLDRGFLLLEDLGRVPYLERLDAATADDLYHDALAAMVRIQRHTPTDGLPEYDAARLHSEMDLFHEWFLPRHLGVALEPQARRTLRRAQELLVEHCLAQPRTFVHRDYHSRNLMVLAHRNPGILDFQDAVRGPATYDLVSLLKDVYVQWPDQDVARWVRVYGSLAREQGVLEVDDDQLLRWFDFTGVQRHLKVAGIFARLNYRDGKPRYLGDLPLTLTYLEQACARYPQLSDLGSLLASLEARDASARATTHVLADRERA